MNIFFKKIISLSIAAVFLFAFSLQVSASPTTDANTLGLVDAIARLSTNNQQGAGVDKIRSDFRNLLITTCGASQFGDNIRGGTIADSIIGGTQFTSLSREDQNAMNACGSFASGQVETITANIENYNSNQTQANAAAAVQATAPNTPERAAAVTNANNVDALQKQVESQKPVKCELSATSFLGSLGACIADAASWLLSWTILPLVAWLLWLAGYIMDAAINFCVVDFSKIVYPTGNGVGLYTVWKIVRDIINIIFVFYLFYLAIKSIIGVDEIKKKIPTIIFAVLLMNFSLFFTKAAIDLSNIAALQFYAPIKASTLGSDSPISARIMGGLKLQSWLLPGGFGTSNSSIDAAAADKSLANTIMAIVFIFIAAIVVFEVAMMFIGRAVALIIVLVFSPAMFVSSLLVPGKVNAKANEWWTLFTEQLIMAPVFFLMLWVIFKLIDTNIIGLGNTSSDFNGILTPSNIGGNIQIILSYFILIVLLQKALEYAKKSSGEAGAIAVKWGGKVAGGALGVASGGVGYAGRRTIGLAASKMMQGSEQSWWGRQGNRLKDAAATNKLAQFALQGVNYGQKATFDARNGNFGVASLLKQTANIAGQKTNVSGSKFIDDLTKSKGGYSDNRKQTIDDRIKATQDRAKLIEIDKNMSFEEEQTLRKAYKANGMDDYAINQRIKIDKENKKNRIEEKNRENKTNLASAVVGELQDATITNALSKTYNTAQNLQVGRLTGSEAAQKAAAAVRPPTLKSEEEQIQSHKDEIAKLNQKLADADAGDEAGIRKINNQIRQYSIKLKKLGVHLTQEQIDAL